jgi:hypothetical protein
MAAGTKRLIVWTIDVIDFLLGLNIKLMLEKPSELRANYT